MFPREEKVPLNNWIVDIFVVGQQLADGPLKGRWTPTERGFYFNLKEKLSWKADIASDGFFKNVVFSLEMCDLLGDQNVRTANLDGIYGPWRELFGQSSLFSPFQNTTVKICERSKVIEKRLLSINQVWSNGKDAQDDDDGRTSRRAWLSKLRPLFAPGIYGPRLLLGPTASRSSRSSPKWPRIGWPAFFLFF